MLKNLNIIVGMNEDGKWNLMDNKLLSFLPAAIIQLLIMITKGNINARRLIAIIIFVKLRIYFKQKFIQYYSIILTLEKDIVKLISSV